MDGKERKIGKGVGNGRIYSLAYADDVVLVAEDERGMKLMMKTFEEYVKEKDLTVNVRKTKMMCFRKRKQKIEYEWRIAGEEVGTSGGVLSSRVLVRSGCRKRVTGEKKTGTCE